MQKIRVHLELKLQMSASTRKVLRFEGKNKRVIYGKVGDDDSDEVR